MSLRRHSEGHDRPKLEGQQRNKAPMGLSEERCELGGREGGKSLLRDWMGGGPQGSSVRWKSHKNCVGTVVCLPHNLTACQFSNKRQHEVTGSNSCSLMINFCFSPFRKRVCVPFIPQLIGKERRLETTTQPCECIFVI